MPLFKITRTIPGVADWDDGTKAAVAEKSNGIVADLFPVGDYNWKTSAVIGPNTLVCYHEAADEEAVRKHSATGDFPVDSVEAVDKPDLSTALWTMGPETANMMAAAAE